MNGFETETSECPVPCHSWHVNKHLPILSYGRINQQRAQDIEIWLVFLLFAAQILTRLLIGREDSEIVSDWSQEWHLALSDKSQCGETDLTQVIPGHLRSWHLSVLRSRVMETSTLCGLWGWRPTWIQRFARKEVRLERDRKHDYNWADRYGAKTVPVSGFELIHDKMLWFFCSDLHPAVLCAGGGAGHGPHLPLLGAHHHWEAVRDQVPGGGMDLLRERDQPDRFYLCHSLPDKVERTISLILTSYNIYKPVKTAEENPVDIYCANSVRLWYFPLRDALSGKSNIGGMEVS